EEASPPKYLLETARFRFLDPLVLLQPAAKPDSTSQRSISRCGCQAAASISPCVPVIEAADWTNYIASNLDRSVQATQPAFRSRLRGWRNYFCDRFPEARDSNRFTRLADFFEDAQALGLELRNGYFFHLVKVYYGQ